MSMANYIGICVAVAGLSFIAGGMFIQKCIAHRAGLALFSMVTKSIKQAGTPDGQIHHVKHTAYTIDHEFETHLKGCQLCRRQMIASLLETIAMLENRQWDEGAATKQA